MTQFTLDITFEITKFIDKISDYIHFAQINKYFHNLMLLEENIIKTIVLNELLKRNEIKLSNDLPIFLMKLENLNLVDSDNNDFNLLDKFPNLKTLNVKKLPANNSKNLNNLTKLEELIISADYFYSDFSSLNKLKKLSFNSLWSLQEEYSLQLPNLTELYLNGYSSQFTGKLFKNLKQLKILHIRNTNVGDEYLTNLINLTELDISLCLNIDGTSLKNLKQLKILHMTLTSVTKFKESIGDLVNLTFLDISPHYTTSEKINTNFLQNLKNLETLNISYFYYRDEDFYNLKNLKKLYILGNNILSFKYFSGKCFKFLQNLKELNGTFTMESQYFKYLTNLKELELRNINEPFTLEDFYYLKNINQLTLTIPNNINDNYLQSLTCLKYLNLSKSQSIVGDCLKNLVNLKFLNASRTNIKDEHLINLKKLIVLNIDNCKNITGECFQHLNQLITLQMNEATNVKEDYLGYLTSIYSLYTGKCPNLISGKFLLQMNNLTSFGFMDRDGNAFNFELDNIEKIKSQIRQGINFMEI